MKLSISRERDVMVLNVSGEFGPTQLKPMKDGILKFLKSGKNKIVIDLRLAKVTSPEILSEVALLNDSARELHGEIVIIGASDGVCAYVAGLGLKNPMKCLADMIDALQFFGSPAVVQGAAGAPGSPAPNELEARILKLEKTDIPALENEKQALELKVKTLEAQVASLVWQRRDPADKDSAKDRITQLEEEVATLLEATQAKKPAAPA